MLSNMILQPLYTEKSLKLAAKGYYTFRVPLEATKPQIKAALKTLFEVDAKSVKTMTTKGEHKRVGKTRTKVQKPSIKKAVVTLEKGQKIALFEPEKEEKK